MMKRSFFAFALIGLALLAGLVFTVQSSSSTAQTNAQAVAAANQLVNAGHLSEAAQMYEQLAAQNPRDAALFYNLGNARFLQGDASRAIAAYEQAAALAPPTPTSAPTWRWRSRRSARPAVPPPAPPARWRTPPADG